VPRRRSRRVGGALCAAVALAWTLSACASGSQSGAASADGAEVRGTINVFAAASLKEAFTTLAAQFESAQPGTRVTLVFGPSSGLATQINQGAPADVFASASERNMDQVVAAGGADRPTTFARNVMAVAVPAGNPAGVSSLPDLARPGVKVALCQAEVPCGATAAKVLGNAGLTVRPVTEEVDVKSVLSKVTLGEVDAGLVYVTDVRAAGDKVRSVSIPQSLNASTSYPIATVASSKNRVTARAFTDFVRSAAGSAVLTAAGFTPP